MIQDFLAPASTISAQKVAKKIERLDSPAYSPSRDTSDRSSLLLNRLFNLWEVVIAMAKQIPDTDGAQDRLVLLLKELATPPSTEIELRDVSTSSSDISRIVSAVDPWNNID